MTSTRSAARRRALAAAMAAASPRVASLPRAAPTARHFGCPSGTSAAITSTSSLRPTRAWRHRWRRSARPAMLSCTATPARSRSLRKECSASTVAHHTAAHRLTASVASAQPRALAVRTTRVCLPFACYADPLPLQTVGSTARRLARKSVAGHSCRSTLLARRGLWRTRVRAASRPSGPSARTPALARAAGTRGPGAPPCLPRRCGALAMHACSESQRLCAHRVASCQLLLSC